MSEREAEVEAVDQDPQDAGRPRGVRYRRAVLFGLLGIAAGAGAGWMARAPLYRAEALVYIAPYLPNVVDPGGKAVLPMFEGFVAYQVQVLSSQAVADGAMQTEAWRKTGRGMSPEMVADFLERRSVIRDPGTHHVRVRFANEKPDIALAGVRALIEVYAERSREESGDEGLKDATAQTEILAAKVNGASDPVLKEAVEQELAHMKALREQLEAQRIGKGRVQIADQGALPVSPSEDERPLFAALGGALGSLLGVGIAVGWRRNAIIADGGG